MKQKSLRVYIRQEQRLEERGGIRSEGWVSFKSYEDTSRGLTKVSLVLVNKIFIQIFAFINVQLFDSVLVQLEINTCISDKQWDFWKATSDKCFWSAVN
ncbi:uncharacterized protein LOC131039077 isoform X2 [Cryptomeria japonica]|uniref:uncharacterized protein LOC131039077 isoform X2 n=1 Tax=Cryptomeria japonica TaxID=3369 RepID=UPI0025AC2278|nr:uncharacterized protein LOC131039077 isoform X2 [Cryptomeria japonica]